MPAGSDGCPLATEQVVASSSGRAWLPTRARWLFLAVAFALVSGCYRTLLPPPLMGTSSLSVGEWSGTTSQGMPIAFSVSEDDETVTTITLGYDFNGCSGSNTYADLSVPTTPNAICIPGPCSQRLLSGRSFAYSDGSFGNGPYTQINGLFLPRNQARGQAVFRDYPACGTATVEWSATRR